MPSSHGEAKPAHFRSAVLTTHIDTGRADLKGAAYQEIVGTNLRGDRGQYFTPRAAIRLVVEMLAPGEEERVLDPACGTGGFLVATLAHRMDRFREEAHVATETETSEEFESLHRRRSSPGCAKKSRRSR